MTLQSATITVDTDNTFEKVATLASVTFTSGDYYTIQVQNTAYFKVGDAIFTVRDKIFTYKASSEELHIKNEGLPCILTILDSDILFV